MNTAGVNEELQGRYAYGIIIEHCECRLSEIRVHNPSGCSSECVHWVAKSAE